MPFTARGYGHALTDSNGGVLLDDQNVALGDQYAPWVTLPGQSATGPADELQTETGDYITTETGELLDVSIGLVVGGHDHVLRDMSGNPLTDSRDVDLGDQYAPWLTLSGRSASS